MIYLVSGYPRSGTSLLCQMCEAGGMVVARNSAMAHRRHRRDSEGYQTHPGDVYECSARERSAVDWPRRQHDGHIVKAVTMWLGDLAVAAYDVAFLWRDPEEVRQSYEAAFGVRLSASEVATRQEEGLRALRNRRDVTRITEIAYADLVSDPERALATLAWPLDMALAASVVDPARYRFRSSCLVEGA